jgi:hypothetical protein
MVKKIFILLCLSLLAVPAMAAHITTRVDRDPVGLDESFKIIFEADESLSASPDFSPLEKDFDILSRSRSSSMQIINGSISQKTQWNLSVMAKHSGRLTIPSIDIDGDRSPQISVTVKKAGTNSSSPIAGNGDMFLEVQAQPTSAYVQSQILYTIRFFRAVNVNGASMSEPSFSGGEVLKQKLGDDSSYVTRRNGRRYEVIERRYALFPQQSGTLTINPLSLDAQVVTASPGIFDPFGQNTTTRRLKSKSIHLDVKPIPTTMANKPWLPATDLQLTEHWSQQQPHFVVGEPVTRTLTLKAEGLTAAQLPSLKMQQSDGFKLYPDQPRLNDKRGSQGISGTRQEKIAIIPTRPGSVTLPAIEIPWWNTATQRMEVAKLPARTIQVQPAANGSPTAAQPAVPQQPQAPAQNAAEETQPPTPETKTTVVEKQASGFYGWLSLALGLGWLGTAVAWFINSRRQRALDGKPEVTQTAAPRASLNAVKQACMNNDARQCKTTLLQWANCHWPDNPPSNLGEIGRRMQGETQQEIEKLSRVLYAENSTTWQGEALWQTLKKESNRNSNQGNKKKDRTLRPLYP